MHKLIKMTKAEHKIISSFFKNKVHECEGLSYEDLFVKIMVEHNPNFQLLLLMETLEIEKTMVMTKKQELIIKFMHQKF